MRSRHFEQFLYDNKDDQPIPLQMVYFISYIMDRYIVFLFTIYVFNVVLLVENGAQWSFMYLNSNIILFLYYSHFSEQLCVAFCHDLSSMHFKNCAEYILHSFSIFGCMWKSNFLTMDFQRKDTIYIYSSNLCSE